MTGMDCNKEEAERAKKVAEKKLCLHDYKGARKFAQKAYSLFPDLDSISQILAVAEVHTAAISENPNSGNKERDWYGILQVNPSSDDAVIKKQYRKLAFLLHPDKNKFTGAESAFKLVGESWQVLSDPAKRNLFNQKRSVNLNPNKNYEMPVSQNPPAFWTICPCCLMQYQYLKIYENQNLLCPSCRIPFIARVITVPMEFPTYPKDNNEASLKENVRRAEAANERKRMKKEVESPEKEANMPEKDQHREEIAVKVAVDIRKMCKKKLEAVSGGNNKKGFQSPFPTDNPTDALLKKVIGTAEATKERKQKKKEKEMMREKDQQRQEYDRERSEKSEKMAKEVMEKRKQMQKKKSLDLLTLKKNANKDGNQRINSKVVINDDEIEAFQTSKKTKLNARENHDKLIGSKNKFIKKGIGELDNSKVEDQINLSPIKSCGKNDEIIDEGSERAGSTVLDAEFHDFDADREEKDIQVGQVWAAYDELHELPRYYMQIKSVIRHPVFKVRIRWLELRAPPPEKKKWIRKGLSFACGDFRLARRQTISSINTLSHIAKWEILGEGNINKERGGAFIRIYPKKGEPWALFHDWNILEFAPEHRLTGKDFFKYDLVEVMSDSSSEGIMVNSLVRVKGFRTLFQRVLGENPWLIPLDNLTKFSHRLPAYKMKGREALGVPQGCWELDPASLPPGLISAKET